MKVAILSTVNLKHMTIVSIYMDYFKRKGIPYDLIYIDKYGEEEFNDAVNCYKFQLRIKRNWNPVRKALHYMKFRGFAKKYLKEGNYDFIVTWNMLTGMMFGHFLKKKFKGKYCLNIRDIGTSGNAVLKLAQNVAIRNCAFATVSSPAFEKYLPKHEYLFMQSLNTSLLEKCQAHKKLKEKDEVINITYIGYVCYYDNCYKIIDSLCNDKRFKLRFYGEGTNLIKEYAESIGAKNVVVKGRFRIEETPDLIQDSDIIYNLYGNENINLRTALSIKLYYAIYLHVPILVCENTYMKEIADELGIGITVKEMDSGFGDYLYDKYHQFDQTAIDKNCNEHIKIVNKGNSEIFNRLDNIFSSLEG